MEYLIIAAVIAGGFLVYYFLHDHLKNLRAGKFGIVFSLAEKIVRAAEQKFPEEGSGQEKKAYVVAEIQKVLKDDLKITVSDTVIENAIEAGVWLLNFSKNRKAEKSDE